VEVQEASAPRTSPPQRGTADSSEPAVPLVPFDVTRLDALLEELGVDVLLASSPHNLQYLLGGYRFFMYSTLDSIGLGRYLPILAYRRGRPHDAVYVGAGNEDWGTNVNPPWVPEIRNVAWSTEQAAQQVAERLAAWGGARGRIGVELDYLPASALRTLSQRLGAVEPVDATAALEELRAVKDERELELVRVGANAVVDAMLATFAATDEGDTKAAIAERLRREQTARGITFAYCLIACGSALNRAPSSRRLAAADVLSLDSGAHHQGYVSDLTRMGRLGPPRAVHDELLGQVDRVQEAARAVVRAGTRGADVFAAAEDALRECPDRERMSFLAHGTGLVTHEAPRLTATGSPPYPATHAERPLQAGMVLSVETHLAHPTEGFVKLEDTVIVTAGGHEAVGDHGRGWNAIGR